MFSPDLVMKIQEAEKGATQYRKEKLVMRDRETIFGGLSHLVTVPKQRDHVMTRVKLTEAKLRRAEKDCIAQPVRFEMHVYTSLFIFVHVGFVSSDHNLQGSLLFYLLTVSPLASICVCRDPETMTFRRTLLETPSGFAIFDVSEKVFKSKVLILHLIHFLFLPFGDSNFFLNFHFCRVYGRGSMMKWMLAWYKSSIPC